MRVRLRGLRVRLRLRGWRPVSGSHPEAEPRPDLPAIEQSRALAGWLAGPRSRALRRAAIGLRTAVLEAGSGHGVVTAELARRARGEVICLDINQGALTGGDYPQDTLRVAGDCRALPFPDAGFDLVFYQNVLMWVDRCGEAVAEAARVLEPGGALVALEPDYGGMMEAPELGLRELWIEGLRAAGADPLVGRRLPAMCEAAGLEVWVELAHLPQEARAEAVALLEGLPLTGDQRARAADAAARIASATGRWQVFIHVPYFIIVAVRSPATR